MFRSIRRLISCVLIVGISAISPCSSLPAHASAPTASIVIGEVSWSGSSLSTADEWIEIWNIGDATTSLAGWSLRGASDAPSLAFPFNAAIAPHGLYLVSNYATNDTKSVLTATPDLVTTAVSLSNSALTIELVDASDTVVDTVGTGKAPFAGASLPIKMSMLRLDPTSDGALASSWASATTTAGMKNSVTDLGTPGLCDVCGTSSVVPKTEMIAPPELISYATSSEITSTLIVDETTQPPSNSEPTTTDAIVEPTSTEVIVVLDAPTDVATTTADAVASSTEKTAPAVEVAAAIQNIPTAAPVAPVSPPPKPAHGLLRLNEVFPAPSSGKEWIEIMTLDAGTTINLKGCEIHDANRRIFTIGTNILDPTVSRYVQIPLSGSKLNNSGDTISLYAPDGRLLDTMKYDTTKKDEAWVRSPYQADAWLKTTTPTPGATNILTAPVMLVAQTTSSTNTGLISLSTTSTVDEENAEVLAPDAVSSDDAPLAPTSMKTIGSKMTSSKKTTAPARASKQTTAAKATTKSKIVALIHPFSFDMLTHDVTPDIRVRLTGRVGSLPGLLSGHAFVLQNTDGRGLLVSVPTKIRLPLFGSDVSVSGSLLVNDKGAATLKMAAADSWTAHATSTNMVSSRIVDLLAPAGEDAWSLMSVTGTVTNVSGGTVHLDLNDAEVDILIKPLIKYRAKRLVIGDVISVTGLLDTTRDDPRIIPRSVEEIRIVKNAPPKNEQLSSTITTSPGPTIPGWAPFGAAAGAVGVTEGTKRFYRRRKIHVLEKKLATL